MSQIRASDSILLLPDREQGSALLQDPGLLAHPFPCGRTPEKGTKPRRNAIAAVCRDPPRRTQSGQARGPRESRSAGLSEECRRVKELGFGGKICIHPSQLEPVNRAFSPTSEEVERARKIVAAAEAQGTGAIVVDGRMVDKAVLLGARRIVEAAERLEPGG